MTDRKREPDGKFTKRIPLAQAEVGDEPESHALPEGMAAVESGMSRAKRPHRVPVGQANRLVYSQRPGYYRRVVNDDPQNPGRIQQHLDAGYEFVYGDETGGELKAGDPTPMQTKVSKQVGHGITGYLMEQPLEYRKEDLALQHQRINESEEDMKRTMVGSPGRYGRAAVNEKEEEVNPLTGIRTPVS